MVALPQETDPVWEFTLRQAILRASVQALVRMELGYCAEPQLPKVHLSESPTQMHWFMQLLWERGSVLHYRLDDAGYEDEDVEYESEDDTELGWSTELQPADDSLCTVNCGSHISTKTCQLFSAFLAHSSASYMILKIILNTRTYRIENVFTRTEEQPAGC